MLTRPILKFTFYLLLATGSSVFVFLSFDDYFKGHTSFDITEVPFTLHDLPTLTFCFQHSGLNYKYDTDLTAKVIFGNLNITLDLEVDKSVQTSFGLDISLTNFYTKDKKLKCYKISNDWDGSGTIDVADLDVKTEFEFYNSSIAPSEADMTLTSEDNSYGLAWNRWFDGKRLKAQLEINTQSHIKIVSINEYQYIPYTCTAMSFYQCLAKRFESLDFSSAEFNVTNSCNYNQTICSTVSLPFQLKVPICKNDGDRKCFEAVLENLYSNQYGHCGKTCHLKEFSANLVWTTPKWKRLKNKFVFGYIFDQPVVTKNIRLQEPMKTVRSEYYIITGMTLVGNVGGILSMFIGFSILTTAECILNIFGKGLKWIHDSDQDTSVFIS